MGKYDAKLTITTSEESMDLIRQEGGADFIRCCIRIFKEGIIDPERITKPYSSWLPEVVTAGKNNLSIPVFEGYADFCDSFDENRTNTLRKMVNIYLSQRK